MAEVEEGPEQQKLAVKTGRTAMKLAAEQLCFSKPTKEMANHLKPLFINANCGGVPIPKVMIDGGAAISLLPHKLLTKMGRTEKDLIPTCLTVTNFVGGTTRTHGILDVDVIVGTKKLKIAFFCGRLVPLTMHYLAETGSTRAYVFLPPYTNSWPSGMKRVSWK